MNRAPASPPAESVPVGAAPAVTSNQPNGCWPPYTQEQPHYPGRPDAFCPSTEPPVWSQQPDTHVCCAYRNVCSAPAIWLAFGSREECERLPGAECVPGASLSSDGTEEHCSPDGKRVHTSTTLEAYELAETVRFELGSPTLSRREQRVVENLAGFVLAYHVRSLSVDGRAGIEETHGEVAAKQLAGRRAGAIKSALLHAGVSPRVVLVRPPVARHCQVTRWGVDRDCGSSGIDAGPAPEEMRNGTEVAPRWQICDSEAVLRSTLTVAGDEGRIRVELCHNDRCGSYEDSAQRLAHWPGAASFTLFGPLEASAFVSPTLAQVERNTKFSLPASGPAEYTLTVTLSESAPSFKQGDRVRVALYRNAEDAPYLSAERVLTYRELYPNGRERDKTPCLKYENDVALEPAASVLAR
ncbi:MAG TPA: hypothetical protein VGI10_17805 [Polyangiaceae bacterium]